MIDCEVHRNQELLMCRTFYDPNMSLEMALKSLEMYIINEELNKAGECLLRVKYTNLSKQV